MLKGLIEFTAVVEQGNFSLAAEKLEMTRARVSQIIAELEQSLSVQLFKRSTRRIQLTTEGELFYQQVQQGITLLNSAIDDIKTERRSLLGTIKLNSVGGYFGEQILAPVLFRFMNQYPQIQIELDFSSTHVDLIGDKYDLVVRMGDLPDSNLIARPLIYYPSYVCASPEYLNQFEPVEHPKQLTQLNCIVGSMKKWRFYQVNTEQQADINVHGQLECANGHIAKLAALNGVGVVRLPGYYVEAEMQSGKLLNVVNGWQARGSQVSLVYAKNPFRPARLQTLIEFLCDAFHQ